MPETIAPGSMTIIYDGNSVDTTLDELEGITRRLEGTEFVAVTVKGMNGEWLETPPRLGDKIKLTVVATVIETGKRLTDDGIQATAKLEVVGVTVL